MTENSFSLKKKKERRKNRKGMKLILKSLLLLTNNYEINMLSFLQTTQAPAAHFFCQVNSPAKKIHSLSDARPHSKLAELDRPEGWMVQTSVDWKAPDLARGDAWTSQ